MENGVIKKWFDDRNFGFITPDRGGKDVFAHIRSFPPSTTISEGDRVSFTIESERDGRLRAVNARLI
jgi:cold shock CspA family protein